MGSEHLPCGVVPATDPQGPPPDANDPTWSTALPPSSHAASSPPSIRRGGLPHLNGLQTMHRASFLISIEGDDANLSWTSLPCGSVAVPIDRWL
jgi:hypothetical protein